MIIIKNISRFHKSAGDFFNHKKNFMPIIKMSFYDNPYLLKSKDQFDIYTLSVPLHLYIKDNENKITVYSMTKSWVDYNRNKDIIYDFTDTYSNQMLTLLNTYTINNQNIIPIKNSLCWSSDNLKYTKKSLLPVYVYPKQQKNNKLKVNYNPMYDIRTLLKLDKGEKSISQVYSPVDEYYE
jgi:hypothetical protein